MTEKTEKNTPAKAKTPAVKPATVVRKSVTAKPVLAKPVKPEIKKKKTKNTDDKARDKVIRASFTMPQSDYEKIVELKQLCLKAGVQVKKSELVRVGLHALSVLSAAQLKKAVAQIAPIKAGRPKKSKDALLSD